MGVHGHVAMKKKYYFVIILLMLVAFCDLLFIGIYRKWQNGGDGEGITVAASFYPIYIAASNIVGDCAGIRLESLSEPQTGCLHDFVLTPEDMKLLSHADVFFVNGGGMETFIDDVTAQYEELIVVETADGLTLADGNAHVWMGIASYKRQVSVMLETLCALAPEYEKELRSNAEAYEEKLAALQEQQEEIKAVSAGKQIVSFHEAFSYLAKDYGLSVGYELNLDEERQVGAGEVADVLNAIKESNLCQIFAEEQYGRGLAETISAETDVDVYYLDTLVRGDYDPDSYVNGMQQNINLLKKAFGV